MGRFFGQPATSSIQLEMKDERNEGYLLKKRGIRRPSFREVGVVPPKLGIPPCCRGMDICGFMFQEAQHSDGVRHDSRMMIDIVDDRCEPSVYGRLLS